MRLATSTFGMARISGPKRRPPTITSPLLRVLPSGVSAAGRRRKVCATRGSWIVVTCAFCLDAPAQPLLGWHLGFVVELIARPVADWLRAVHSSKAVTGVGPRWEFHEA